MGFKATYTATFVRRDGTWYFAGYTPGKISRRLPGGCTVTVEYSFGLRRDAAALLRAAARYAREYTALYGAAPPRVHITLYQTPRELRNTVEAGRFEKLYLWHEPGGSIRMCFAPGQDTAANLPALRREMNSHWIHSLSGGNAAAFLCDGLNALNQTENALQQAVQPCTVTANGFADTGPVDPETLPAYLAASYHVRAASYAAALCNEYGFDAIARALPIMARAPMAQSPDAALEITMAALQEVTGDTLTAADMDALVQKWSQSDPME